MKAIKEKLKKEFKDANDFVCQEIKLDYGKSVYLCYIDNMIDKMLVSKCIVGCLSDMKLGEEPDIDLVLTNVQIAGSKIEKGYQKAKESILNGLVVVLADWFKASNEFISAPCQGFEKRNVQEPPTSAVLRGPREGFTEDVTTNMSLIRRRLKTSDLIFEEVRIGKYSASKVVIAYVKSIADAGVVKEVKQRLKKINIDAVIDSFYIQSLLETHHSGLFKQVGNTEKPDVAASKIIEGRVAILVDGSPMVLTVPFVFLEDLQSGDDYYNHPIHASAVRIIRVLGMVIAITLPGIYVALESFHYALMPIDFLISLQNAIEGLSFSPLIEILIVLFLFEILNEASIRMPKYSGMALSIVGALVLGDTAVKAGVISPPAVIMVAISAITLFTVPDQVAAVSVMRLVFTLLGGVAGFYGIIIGFVFLISYLNTFDSYGTPYFAPFTPNIQEDKKDAIIKSHLSQMTTRPHSIPNINRVRQKHEKGIN